MKNGFRLTPVILVLCIAILLFSGNLLFPHLVAAAGLSSPGSPTPTSDPDPKSLAPNMNCAQPPTNVDHAALSNADLDRYGLPRYKAGQNKADWQQKVRALKHRVCGGTKLHRKSTFTSTTHPTTPSIPGSPSCSAQGYSTSHWTGNMTVNSVTDSRCKQNNTYVEADAVFYVPCVAGGPGGAYESNWVGLGGFNNNYLVQAGTETDNVLGSDDYYAWTENTADGNLEQWLFNVNCNDEVQVTVHNGNETFIQDFTNGYYADTQEGPAASNATAEWIVEATEQCDWLGNNCTVPPLADFGSVTFYGMGTTLGSGKYVSPADIDHDYTYMSNNRTTIGSLVYNTFHGPPDYSNTITWRHS